MSILGVRVELFVNDVGRSARFYREVLGFRAVGDIDETGYVPVSSGALTIGLQGHANLPSGHHFRREHFGGPRGVGVEIQIEVDDVDALYALAVATAPALGGGIEPIGDRSWGLRDFRIIDLTVTISASRHRRPDSQPPLSSTWDDVTGHPTMTTTRCCRGS
jgi:lactoylglutathione lyase